MALHVFDLFYSFIHNMHLFIIQFESWVQIDTWWQAQQDKESLVTALCPVLYFPIVSARSGLTRDVNEARGSEAEAWTLEAEAWRVQASRVQALRPRTLEGPRPRTLEPSRPR